MAETEKCDLCPYNCEIPEGMTGKCRVRGNVNGHVMLLTYGKVTTAIVGPVEQKPLYHYYPGMKVLSIGSSGCNFACAYCQNFEISQVGDPDSKEMSPLEVVEIAQAQGAEAIAFTYSEPIVWFEYVVNVARVAKKVGLKTILKTAGYCNPEKFKELLWDIDAINIDVKGPWRLYREVVGIELEADPSQWVIIKNLEYAWRHCHTEVSTIAIPPYCNDPKGMAAVFSAMRNATSQFLPVHVLKFIPDFKMRNTPPTSDAELLTTSDLARMYFHSVYIDYAGIDAITRCHRCRENLVARKGIELVSNTLTKRAICYNCGAPQYFEV